VAYKRTKLSLFVLATLAVVLGFSVVAYATPPGFKAALNIPRTSLSPFPDYESEFSVSILSPGFYWINSRGLRPFYNYDYSYDDHLISYTYQINKEVGVIPVTSDLEVFRQHRLYQGMQFTSRSITKRSLVKDQKQKAGSLFSINIPIRSRLFESVFGEGGAGLKVSGYRRITFSGSSTWSDKQSTAYANQSKFPSLRMEQTYSFDITGNIGSKITVKVTQDSRNDIPLANRLILRYKGFEDDVLQTVEAGNTTLDLPSTQFLRYSTRVQGLFGVKATAQIADVSVTAIASQEKGSTESVEISGSSSSATNTVRDIDYRKRLFFDLGVLPIDRARSDTINTDEIYADTVGHNYQGYRDHFDFVPGLDSIITLKLYVDDKPSQPEDQIGRFEGYCYVQPPPADTLAADPNRLYTELGSFELVEEKDYYLFPQSFYIQFTSSSIIQSNYILAAYMEVQRKDDGGNTWVDTIGVIDTDTLRLKLLKPTTHSRINHHVWEYEWKNVYYLGYTNVDRSDLEVTVYKRLSSGTTGVSTEDIDVQDEIPYIQILGLDQGDNSGTGDRDGIIDRNKGDIIDDDLGYLVFPNRHPFDSDEGFIYESDGSDSTAILLQDSVPQIYVSTNSTTVTSATNYYLAIKTKQGVGSTIDLNTSNIIENSEVVTYNSVRLIRGEDYTIDYDFGSLTLLKDEYTDVASNLSIMYESAPFYSLSQKTLLGTRIEYEPSRDFNVGTTLLYKSDKSNADKPKVGEESSNMFVWDFDLGYRLESELLTRIADAIPLVDAKASSYVQLTAELAQSRPNPNINGDVYLDDFEGSEDSYSLSVRRGQWFKASRPETIDPDSSERARMAWFNIEGLYDMEDVWNVDESYNSYAEVMTIRYQPVNFLRYDSIEVDDITGDTTEIVDTTNYYLDPEKSWNGFMRYIPSGVITQLQDVQLLELRVKGEIGILHIDLGRITEDINDNGQNDTEDQNYNDLVDDGEDTGLDKDFDSDEFGYDATANPDPSGDNWVYPTDDQNLLANWWKVNGTEGNNNVNNGDAETGSAPDTEDRNDNGFEKNNDYFSFKVDLSDTTESGFEVPGTRNANGWRTIRIPIREPDVLDTVIGAPEWNEIRFARIWIDSINPLDYSGDYIDIHVAGIDLVSNNWGDSLYIADSLRSGEVNFDVAVINDEVNADYFSPPGVEGEYDEANDIQMKEQSLLLEFENLKAGILVHSEDSGLVMASDTGLAVKILYSSQNYMGYRKLEVWVRGEETEDDSLMFFLRLGYDKNYYYEWRNILKPGDWQANPLVIDFAEITGLKAELIERREDGDSVLVIQDGEYLVKIKSSGTDPSLTRIKYFAAGVVNLDPDRPASGQVWLDELRLTEVKDDIGMAARAQINGTMSDLLTYSFSYATQDAYYRGVSSSTKGGSTDNLGSGRTDKSYSFNGRINLNKFFPRSLQLSLPISVSWTQREQDPLLKSGTDITVPDEFKAEETSFSVTKSISVSESVNKKTNNFFFKYLLNLIRTSFSYSLTKGRSSTQPMYYNERWSTSASYKLSARKVFSLPILFWTKPFHLPWGLGGTKLYLYPTSLDLTGSAKGSFSQSKNQSGDNPISISRDFSGRMSVRYSVMDNLATNLTMSTSRDLTDMSMVNITINPNKFRLGLEESYDQSFTANYDPRLFPFLTHSFDYTARYSDRYNISYDSIEYHSASVTRTFGVSLTFDHRKLLGTNSRRSNISRDKDKGGAGILGVFKPFLTGIRYITDNIKQVNGNFSRTESISPPALSNKATWAYRLGLSNDPGVDTYSNISGTIRETKSLKRSYSASSGVNFFSGLGADVSFSQTINERFDTSPYKDVSTKWPDVSFNFRTAKGLWIFNDFISALSPRSGFTRNTSEKRHINYSYPYQKSENVKFSPLLSVSWNPFKSMSTTARYETSNSDTWKYSESSGDLQSAVRSYSSSYSFTLKYDFRNPNGVRLPLFGRVKFESTLSLSVSVSYKKSGSEEAKPSNDFNYTLSAESTSLDVSPTASYSFSSTVRGSISGRWMDTNDLYTNTKKHTRELRINIEMRF